jgi:UDP-N-acetylmuramate dehydrogenase
MPALRIESQVPLARHTTLELGGPAEYFASVDDRAELIEALEWARTKSLPLTVLGGGSNVVVSDDGVRGLVVKLATHGVMFEPAGEHTLVTAQAGENWDALVAACVDAELAGIECLSGIPGSVGAGPVQNIGAYGQELAHCVRSIEVLDRLTLETQWLSLDACAFEYRNSRWKRAPGQEIVLSVRLALTPGAAPSLLYPELSQAIAARGGDSAPSLSEARKAVLALRRGKSMLLDPDDENRRSVGSFFLNPILEPSELERVAERAVELGWITSAAQLPNYPQPDGRVKLSAAWLIERAGSHKGETHGHVGLSSRHSLALVHHGGGSSAELMALAELVRTRVSQCFGIELVPEPVLLGFANGA